MDLHNFKITPNLKYALLRLRDKDAQLFLWVDAICINQEDIPERNVQTANMRAIYQYASSVAVWLGQENHESSAALEMAHDLNHCITKEQVEKLVNDKRRKFQFDAMVILFRRQYWWRIWVIQEVSCAKSAIVYCGEDSISWMELDNVCEILKEQEAALTSIYYEFPSYVRTLAHGGPRGLHLSRYSPSSSAPPLLDLLLSHKSKKSTDPKDKVFALVGISSSRHTFGTIDYSLSMREIYSHTSRHIISSSQKLDVICVRQHDYENYNLPSWVTDWERPPPNKGASLIGLHHHQPEFCAAGDSLADARFSSNGYALYTKGVVVDTIKAVGIPYKKQGPPNDVVPALTAFHDWWNFFVTTHGNTLKAQASFARTISCQRWDFGDDSEGQQEYVEKLEAIFALSDELLSESDILRLGPPSRASTANSSTFSSQDEDDDAIANEVEHRNGDEDEKKTRYSAIFEAILMMNRRRMFFSENERIGMTNRRARAGDMVCILIGCRFPVVLRKVEEHYMLIGEAYVEDFMNGEALRDIGKVYRIEGFEIH